MYGDLEVSIGLLKCACVHAALLFLLLGLIRISKNEKVKFTLTFIFFIICPFYITHQIKNKKP